MFEGKEEKKCKGVKKAVIKKYISFDDYEECLFSKKPQMRKMNVIRSHQHEIFSETVNKIALSADDDKRIILADKISTLAFGHYKNKYFFLKMPEVIKVFEIILEMLKTLKEKLTKEDSKK